MPPHEISRVLSDLRPGIRPVGEIAGVVGDVLEIADADIEAQIPPDSTLAQVEDMANTFLDSFLSNLATGQRIRVHILSLNPLQYQLVIFASEAGIGPK